MKTCPNCKETLGDNVKECFNCHYNFDARMIIRAGHAEAEKKRQELMAQEQARLRELEKQRAEKESEIVALNPEYEYKTVIVYDKKTGGFDQETADVKIAQMAKLGWRLINVVTNEVGKNSSSLSYAGMSVGTNATIDQTVLFFERMIRPAITK